MQHWLMDNRPDAETDAETETRLWLSRSSEKLSVQWQWRWCTFGCYKGDERVWISCWREKSEKPSEAKSLERRKRERTADVMSAWAEQTRRPVKGSELAWQGARSTRGRQWGEEGRWTGGKETSQEFSFLRRHITQTGGDEIPLIQLHLEAQSR